MWIYITLGAVLVVFLILFIMYVNAKNKLRSIRLKINTAEDSIESLLLEKKDKLMDICSFLKKKKVEVSLDDITLLDEKTLNNFEFNEELSKYDQPISEIINFNKDIEFKENELNAFDALETINIDLLASQKYYNDNTIKYNKLISTFPASIIAKSKHYKIKGTYTSKKEEIFEILKK